MKSWLSRYGRHVAAVNLMMCCCGCLDSRRKSLKVLMAQKKSCRVVAKRSFGKLTYGVQTVNILHVEEQVSPKSRLLGVLYFELGQDPSSSLLLLYPVAETRETERERARSRREAGKETTREKKPASRQPLFARRLLPLRSPT